MRVKLEWLNELVDLTGLTLEDIVNTVSLHSIEVENVDSNNENIKLPKSKIEIDNKIITTDKKGYSNIYLPAKSETTMSYSIKQSEVQSKYNLLEDTILDVVYDINGNITEEPTTSNPNVEVRSYNSSNIKLVLKNEKQIGGFSLLLNAVDLMDVNKHIANVKYKVDIQYPDGQKNTIEQQTDINGQIQIPNIDSIGEVGIRITQLTSAPGYKLSQNKPLDVTVNRDEDGNISVVSSKTSIEFEGKIENNNQRGGFPHG